MAENKALIVSVGGVSSSGKTTLARILRDVFPGSFILHEDDFYVEDSRLPKRDGFVDYESEESIKFSELAQALAYVRTNGRPPPDLNSIEDKNSVGKSPVSDSQIQAVKERVAAWLVPTEPGHRLVTPGDDDRESTALTICFLDGFLLYTPPILKMLSPLIDVKLFLRASRERAMTRRSKRDGYVTVDGFWTDPPGYIDAIVWPSYAEAHAWLFEGGDVDHGALDGAVLEREGIQALTRGGESGNGTDVAPDDLVEWAVGLVMKAIEKKSASSIL